MVVRMVGLSGGGVMEVLGGGRGLKGWWHGESDGLLL